MDRSLSAWLVRIVTTPVVVILSPIVLFFEVIDWLTDIPGFESVRMNPLQNIIRNWCNPFHKTEESER